VSLINRRKDDRLIHIRLREIGVATNLEIKLNPEMTDEEVLFHLENIVLALREKLSGKTMLARVK